MTKWMYMSLTLELPNDLNLLSINEKFNEYGLNGYELASFAPLQSYEEKTNIPTFRTKMCIAIFKKPIE